MMKSLLARVRGGMTQQQWLSLLTGVLLFALLNLFLTLILGGSGTSSGRAGQPAEPGWPGGFSDVPRAELWVNVIAAVLAVGIAPYLLRTIDQMQQREARQKTELESLHAIDNALNTQLNLTAILNVAVTEATRAVDGEMGALWLLDEADPTHVSSRAFYNVAPARQHLMAEHVKGTTADAVRQTGRPQRREELDDTWGADHAAMLLKLRSAITVPIKQQETVLGLILIGNRSSASPLAGFTDDDEALLVAIASSLSIAIQNARLYEETQRRGELLRNLVARTGEAVAASSDAPRLMQIFAGEAARVIRCPRVAVYAHVDGTVSASGETQFQSLAFHDESAKSDALPLTFRRPLRIDPAHLPADADGGEGIGPSPPYVGSVCAILGLSTEDAPFLDSPGYVSVLRARDRRGIGLLCLLDHAPCPASRDRDAFAQALAAQAAISLENAQLGERLRLAAERDKNIAETFQNSLLPAIPERAGAFEFAHKYQAALEEADLGGDFYDWFTLDEDTVGIVMADVSGKGLRAAMQTAMVKYMLRGFAIEMPQAPGEVLARVNNALSRETSRFEGFVTLFFGILNTRTGDFVFANAGHEPPLWRDGATQTVSLLEIDSGLPLGCLPATEYESCSHQFAPGDLLLLYTDGLSEARGAENTLLGSEGLRLSLPATADSAQGAIESVYAHAKSFSGNHLRDDVAMLLLRRDSTVFTWSEGERPAALLASSPGNGVS